LFFLFKDGTGANRLLSAEDAPTHYLDCNSFSIQPCKGSKKISLLMTNSKEKPKELKNRLIFKKKDWNN
jgi:hypothetical protein